MKRFDLVFQEEMNDGATTTGMGATYEGTTVAEDTNINTEDEALSMLRDDYQEPQAEQEQETQQQEQEGQQESNNIDTLNDIENDMSMFGNIEQEENPNIQQEQTQQTQGQEPTPQNSQSEMMQQILNKLEGRDEAKENEMSPTEIEALKELTDNLQKAGLLPQGMSEEDKQLLQEAKEMRDNFKQQEQLRQEQIEMQGKIDAIDNYSKELESLIPNYNSEFMVNLVGKISSENPAAGKQILNNPTMLTQLWARYGSKSQPTQEKTNLINESSKQISADDLAQKVMSGSATPDEEASYLARL